MFNIPIVVVIQFFEYAKFETARRVQSTKSFLTVSSEL